MTANFKDIETGELIHVQSHKTQIIDGRVVHFANGEELLGANDKPLESIAFADRGSEATKVIIGSEYIGQTSSSYHKDVAYLKQRTKKHAASDEGQHIRQQSIDREYKSMGLKK